MNSRKMAVALCLIAVAVLLPWRAVEAQTTSSKGVGVVEFGSWGGVNKKIRREAIAGAKINAIERYISQSNQAQLKQFDKIRDAAPLPRRTHD